MTRLPIPFALFASLVAATILMVGAVEVPL